MFFKKSFGQSSIPFSDIIKVFQVCDLTYDIVCRRRYPDGPLWWGHELPRTH